MTDRNTSLAPLALPAVLAATTLSGSIVLACMMPFAAVATVAALAMPARRGAAAVGLCWLGNQVLGFGLMGFPWDGPTFAAGLSLLLSSLIAFAAARAVAGRGANAALAFMAAFAAFEASLFAYALPLGDPSLFAPRIVGLIALNDALWFAGLWLGWQVLARIPLLAAWQAR
jgi:hypothetical protein